jgi:hypothetical protein
MANVRFAVITFSVFLMGAHSSGFLKAMPKERIERISEEDIRSSLLEEVEGTLGEGSATNRLRLLEATLKPMFDALPKNEQGNLGHAAVRYALHRLFVMRHGWNIRGLGFVSAESNGASNEGILKDQVPAYLQNVFEKELGAKGLGLHELSVMAAALEHLIHKEAVSKLGSVFKIFKVFPTAKVTEAQTNEMLDTYMAAFILGENLTNLTLYDARSLNDEMPDIYSSWGETQALVRRIRSNMTMGSNATAGSSPRYSFSSLAKIVQAIGEEYGSFQNIECQQLKSALVKMDSSGSGRVKLADFYQPSLGGSWQFQESVAYLRDVGALDESDADSKSVILVNYLHSPANCIASSGYYSVCCKDECESLLGHLEEKIAAPEASPATIAALVENLPSPTVDRSRTLSPHLVARLDDIAAMHGGMVPLHARLFSQWMHHAYPRECPYPHVSGTTNQQSLDDWALETGLEGVASEEEMREFTTNRKEAPQGQDPEENDRIMASLPWSPEEELLVVRAVARTSDTGFSFSLRPVVLLLLAGSAAMSVMRLFKAGSDSCKDDGNHKFMV